MAGGHRLTPEARANLDDICAFVAEDSIDAALRLVDAFEHAFDQLAAMPGVGHTREELTPRPVKFWRVYSYLVVYDPASTPPTIVAILHGARDVERLLGGPA